MLRGIDSQIAIQRLNDYAKEASAVLKRSELQHDFQSQLGRAVAERQKHQVSELAAKDNPRVAPDGGGGQTYQQREKKKRPAGGPAAGAAADPLDEPRVEPLKRQPENVPHIDIEV